MFQAAAVRGQSVVQVQGWVATDIGRGLWRIEVLLPMPVHGQQCDRIAMGVHTCPGRVGWDGVGPMHTAWVMYWQGHSWLPTTCKVAGLNTNSTRISLLFYDVVPTVGASVMLQQPWIHTLPVEPMGTGDDPKFLSINVLLQTDSTVRCGATAKCIQGPTASFPAPLAFGVELSGFHLLQSLHSQPVHGILTTTLLQLDFDKENEANQGDDDEESQENPHVKVLSGLSRREVLDPCSSYFLFVDNVHQLDGVCTLHIYHWPLKRVF